MNGSARLDTKRVFDIAHENIREKCALASLMVDCGLGVSEERVYRTYRIDSDFFEERE